MITNYNKRFDRLKLYMYIKSLPLFTQLKKKENIKGERIKKKVKKKKEKEKDRRDNSPIDQEKELPQFFIVIY